MSHINQKIIKLVVNMQQKKSFYKNNKALITMKKHKEYKKKHIEDKKIHKEDKKNKTIFLW